MDNATSQKISLPIAIVIAMNAMIGASIFLIPERLQLMVGPAGLISYGLVIFGVWCIASSLALVARKYQEEGSLYRYVEAWAGKKWGIVAGCLYSVGLIVALGLLTRMTGEYLQSQFPQMAVWQLSGISLGLILLTFLVGSQSAKWGQIILLFFTIAPLFIITALCFSKASFSNMVPFMPHGFNSVLKAMQFVIFGFFGFESVTTLQHMVANPQRTVPKTITWSIILVSIIYLAFVLSVFLGLPQDLFSAHGTLPDVLYQVFTGHGWLVTMIVWGIIITILGTIHSVIMAVGSLIQSIIKLSGLKYQPTQKQTIMGIGVVAYMVSVLFSNINLFFNVTAVCIVLVLAAAIMPIVLKKIPSTHPQFITAFLGIFSALVMIGYAVAGIMKAII